MLLPRYSLRATLLGISACAVFFSILGQAFRGQAWAIVISVAWGSIFMTLVFQGLFFIGASFLSRLVGTGHLPARTSQGGFQSLTDKETLPPVRDSTGDA